MRRLSLFAGALLLVLAPMNGVATAQEDAKAELQKKLETVDDTNAEALFELALWAESKGLKTDSKRLLRKVIRVDKNHAEARKALGYVQFEGRWVTEREMERLKRKKEEEEMKAKGFRRYKGEWIPEADYEKYQQGLVPYEMDDGETRWLTEVERERLEKGMVLHEGMWITPEERENLEKGLFKVEFDGETRWVEKDEADKVHEDLLNPWLFEGEASRLTTTCTHDYGKDCLLQADASITQAYQIMGRPMTEDFPKVDLMMLARQEDYKQVGEGVNDALDAAMSSEYACFITQDPESGRVGGVACYQVLSETDVQGNDRFSQYLLRHAAAEAAVRAATWKEEPPRWFSLGIGSYCERYWDPFHATGVQRLGAWSVAALRREGGILKFKNFFDSFAVTRQSVLQSGLVVSYLVHGEKHEKVQAEWDKARELMAGDDHKDLEKTFLKLEMALTKYGEDDFQAYADGLGS